METDADCVTYKNKNINDLALISLADAKSIIIPTIPIFQLRQSSSQAISSLTKAFDRSNNFIGHLNVDINENSSMSNDLMQTNKSTQMDTWANSLFRPATGLQKIHNKRRECKSSSDETSVSEVKITSDSFVTSSSTHRRSAEFTNEILQNNKNVKNVHRLSGQFGINPLAIYQQKITRLSCGHEKLTQNIIKSFTKAVPGNSKSEKKHATKRLGHNTRFFDKKKSADGGNKKLFQTVSSNDFVKLEDLLDSNMYDVNSCDEKQRTCLHIASSRGYLEIIRVLLNYGANPNIRDCVSNLPIHLAIISSHVPVVTLLLEAGTDIHSLDLNGNTVLHLAGTRLRWLLNDDNNKAPAKLKLEAIMIMDMIKQYLKHKKDSTTDLDMLAYRLEHVINLDDMSSLDGILDQFDTLNIKTSTNK